MRKYLIIEIEKNNTSTDGLVLIVKANPVSKIENFDFFVENFGTEYYIYSETEEPETEYFLLPYTESFANKLLRMTQKQGNERLWEVNLDLFYDARLQIETGKIVNIHKSFKFLNSITL